MTMALKALAANSADRAALVAAFEEALAGAATPAQLAAFLTLTAARLEDPEMLEIAARAMRARMIPVSAPAGAIDVCGTGGDGAHTLNVSTAVAFIVAACGVPVAKHGNRAASSRSGAADVLEALGAPMANAAARAERCLNEAGIAFLFAPQHHPALAPLAPVRRELGFRTVFNVLGPLCNPAGVRAQLIGAFSLQMLAPMAETLRRLGAERAWVVHGQGLDELAPCGESHVRALEAGTVRALTLTPQDAGLEPAPLDGLAGGTPQDNASALSALLQDGRGNPSYRAAALLNAAASLVVAGREDLKAAAREAEAALASGAAWAKFEAMRAILAEATP